MSIKHTPYPRGTGDRTDTAILLAPARHYLLQNYARLPSSALDTRPLERELTLGEEISQGHRKRGRRA